MKDINRKLNTLEKTFCALNKTQPFNSILCAHIKGDISYNIFEEAVNRIKKRHYYLFYSIQEIENDLVWVYDENAVIPIEVIESNTDDKWVEICNIEMNVSVILSKAPLTKIIFVKNKNGADIIFKISHIISDGISLYNFIRETLVTVEAISKNTKIQFPDLTEDYPDVDNFPQNLGKIEEVNHFRLPTDLLETYPFYEIKDRNTHIAPYHLSKEHSKIIMEKCKERKITINSLLAAALVLTMKNHILQSFETEEEFTIKSSSGLNLRPYYKNTPKNEQLGCWAGFGIVFFNRNEIKSLWECAAIFQSRLKEFLDQNKPFSHWKNLVDAQSKEPIQEKMGEKNIPLPYVILTNLGKLDMEEWYDGKFQLEKISVMTPMHRHWVNDLGFGVCASTFNDQLNLIFHYMSPARTFEQAENFANQIISLLLNQS